LILSRTKLTKLPNEIGQCKKLKSLGLEVTPVSKKERKKIEKMLPNCEITTE
jgi:Leucine-rich repeat (LRR) protein